MFIKWLRVVSRQKSSTWIVLDLSQLTSDIEGLITCLQQDINFKQVNTEKNNAIRELKRHGCRQWKLRGALIAEGEKINRVY